MKGPKKSPRSQRSRDIIRALLAIIPLPFALSLMLFPELGEFSLEPLLGAFFFGVVVGTIGHIYWLRMLLRERRFYKKFYEETAVNPGHVDPEMNRKHTKIMLPFYVFGVLISILVIFIMGLSGLNVAYLLPFALGALDGVPLSYYIMEKTAFS